MNVTTSTPVWVVNHYAGEQINVEPLFRFNAEPRNPFVQHIQLARTVTVLCNVEMRYREKFVYRNEPDEETNATQLNDLHSLIVALSRIVFCDQVTLPASNSRP